MDANSYEPARFGLLGPLILTLDVWLLIGLALQRLGLAQQPKTGLVQQWGRPTAGRLTSPIDISPDRPLRRAYPGALHMKSYTLFGLPCEVPAAFGEIDAGDTASGPHEHRINGPDPTPTWWPVNTGEL